MDEMDSQAYEFEHLSSTDLKELGKLIRELMDEGYEFHGGMTVTGNADPWYRYHQIMRRLQPREGESKWTKRNSRRMKKSM